MGAPVLAIIGSPRRTGHNHTLVQQLAAMLEEEGVEVEMVHLGELDLRPCRGCYVCQAKGEQFCPLKDDVAAVVERIRAARGVILASPMYAANVSGLMKTFMDRLAWAAHRPPFLGKPAMLVATASGDPGEALRALSWFRYPGFDIVARVGWPVWPSRTMDWERGAAEERKLRGAVRRLCAAMDAPRRSLSLRQVVDFSIMRITAAVDPGFLRADAAWHAQGAGHGFEVAPWKRLVGEVVFQVGRSWLQRRVVPRERSPR